MKQKPSQKLLFWTTAAAAFLEPNQTLVNRLSCGLSVSSGIWGGDFVPSCTDFVQSFTFTFAKIKIHSEVLIQPAPLQVPGHDWMH